MKRQGDIQFGRIPYPMMDSGAVARMTGGEAKTYIVIAAHVRPDWTANPSVKRIAEKAGLTRRAVQQATKGLARKGILEIGPGGGRGRVNRYRLVTKGAPACAFSAPETAHVEAQNGARAGTKGRTDRYERPHGGAPQQIRTEKEQRSTEGAVGDVPVAQEEQKRASINEAILRRMGVVGEATLKDLAQTPALMPMTLLVLAAQAPQDVSNLPGWVRSRIEAGNFGDGGPTPEDIYQAAKGKLIVRIGRYGLDLPGCRLGWNKDWLYVYDSDQQVGKIAASDLGGVEIE